MDKNIRNIKSSRLNGLKTKGENRIKTKVAKSNTPTSSADEYLRAIAINTCEMAKCLQKLVDEPKEK